MLSTNIPDHIRHNASEEAVSVIHAPESFQSWVSVFRETPQKQYMLTGGVDFVGAKQNNITV